MCHYWSEPRLYLRDVCLEAKLQWYVCYLQKNYSGHAHRDGIMRIGEKTLMRCDIGIGKRVLII